MPLRFDRQFDPRHGEAETVAPGVRRVTAANPGPFTFTGTNTYLVGSASGDGPLAVIDPGPADDDHFQALLAAIGPATVSHVLVSHTHRDHSGLAARLARLTGAPLVAEGPHRPARAVLLGETNPLEAGVDHDFQPDIRLADGDAVAVGERTLRAVLTPGHTANHLCFALEGTGILFSADHVMAWATTVVAPPDGSMTDFMASLDKVIGRNDRLLLPGHGGPVTAPRPFLRGLKAHRLMRERAIVARLRAGDRTAPEIVAALYRDTDPRLHGAAALSVLAHLEALVARGLVLADGPPGVQTPFRPA